MYRPRATVVDDVAALHGIVRERVFATLATAADGTVQFAYAPVVLDPGNGPRGGIRYHLAAANPLARIADGTRVSISLVGPGAYVSPDWYESKGLVPTWNYIALEGEGAVRRLSRGELLQNVVDLSAQEEAKLAPKAPWLVDKVAPERLEGLLGAIAGFTLSFERLEGKFKLGQEKREEDFRGAVAGLEARGGAASAAVAQAMRATRP